MKLWRVTRYDNYANRWWVVYASTESEAIQAVMGFVYKNPDPAYSVSFRASQMFVVEPQVLTSWDGDGHIAARKW